MKHAFKKVVALVLALAMIIGVVPAVFAANVGPFTDVDDAAWYAEYVSYVYENELMSGMTASIFAPNGQLTRAQAAVVIYRLAGSPVVEEPATFTDLPQDWYKAAIAWAEDEEIVQGMGDGLFAPNGLVTREQLVTMLWRYYDCPAVEGDYLAAYPDGEQVSDWAVQAMNWALANKVLNGIPAAGGNVLQPQGSATRAQYAKIIAILAGFVPTLEEAVILFTNDVHTYINKTLSYDSIAALKNETASTATGVLLVDAGDHVQGTAYGSMDDGETIIELMNAAGYDLATLGNHEFDYGMERALELVDMANFPYISANFYREENGVRGDNVLNSYRIFELGDYSVAFVGITTPETFTKSTPAYFMNDKGEYIYGIAGGDDGAALYASVQTAIDAARAEGVDYVIALGHCGDDPASQPWTSEEVIANTTGLDAFIDGHSHSTVEEKTVLDESGRPVVLTQTGEYFNAIGRMSISANGISVDLITEYKGYDPKVRALKDAWISEVDQLLGEKIAVSEVDFRIYGDEGRLIRKQETNLGDFTADALYYLFDVTEGLDVDCAIMNGGGIRADMPAGDLSYKSTKTVHTFGNVACLITVTGQQILDALEWGARNVGVGENGGFLQVSGITYEIHSYIESTVQMDDKGVWTGGPTGEYRVKNVTIGGEPLDVTATYNMAGYNYTLRDLGDGFAMFGGAVNVKDYVMEDYLVLANYAKSFPVENGYPTIKGDNSVLGADYSSIYGEGRITIVSEDPGPDTGEICNPHEYSEERVEPTCVTEGYVIYTCTLCGDSYKEILEATGVHEDADRNGECDHCGAAVEVKVEPGDLIGKYFEKVTEDQTDWTGVYMIVVEGVSIEGTATDVAFDGSLGSLDECFNYLEVTVADNKILADEETAASFFEIVKVDGGYTVRSASGLYIGPKDSGNGLSTTDDAAAAYASTITLNEDGTVNLSSSDGRNLRFNSTGSQLRFRYFKSAQTSIYLYKIDVSIPGYEPEEPAAAEYTLTNELKAGDEVIIVNAALNKALSSTYSGFYNSAVDVAPVEGVITTDATDIVWTVGKDGDNYTFSFGGQNIGMQESYSSMPLGAVNDKWTITDGDTANTHFVCNVGRGAYMEYQDTYGTWSAYYDKSSNTQLFELSFYVKNAEGGETPEPDPEPTPDPSGDTYVLSAGLKDGDKVIIVNAAASKALSSEIVSTYYKAGADVTPADGKITTTDTSIVWTVAADGEGFNLINAEGQKLSIDGNYNSIPYDKSNDAWSVATAATENCVYVVNENGKYLQWSSYGNFSAYSYSEANEGTFAMQLYVLGEEQSEPAERYVAIYNPAKGKVMTTESSVYNNKDQIKSADATLENDKLNTEATNVALFKMVTVDGITTFQTEDGKYLYADGTHVRLVDSADDYTSFVLEETDGGWFVKCATANYNGKAQYLEFYANVFTVYGMGSDASIYTFTFHELAAEETEPTPDPEPEPEPEPEEDSYVLATELKDGDKVIIVNAAASKALSSEIVSTYYKAGADVTPADGKITTTDTSIVWTVTAVEGGFELSNSEGQKLSMGASYSSIPYDDVNTVWEILTSTTENCVYVKNAVRGNYLQWSAQYSNYSTYTYSEANESTFAMQLYVLEQEEQPAPVNGLVATALEDIKATDKVLIVTTAGDTSYVLLNNADKGPAQAFDPEAWDDTMLWNIAAVDGGYTIYVNGSTTQWLYGTAANNGLCVGDTTTGSVFNFAVPYEGQNAYLTYTDSASAARYVGVYTATPNFRGYKIGNDGTLTSNITGQSTTFYVVTETTGN